MKSNLHLFTEQTMTGVIAGVGMPPDEYRKYYDNALKDFDSKKRRVKSNYLIEKLKEYDYLEDFEYKYIYEASCARNTGYLLFQVIPLALLTFFKLSNDIGLIIGIFCSIKLMMGVLYNSLYWIPILSKYKDKHFYIKGCCIVNIASTVLYFCCVILYAFIIVQFK